MCGATTMHILQFEGESSQNPIYMCKDFGVPYCCIGSGNTDKDYFASAHENEEIREICIPPTLSDATDEYEKGLVEEKMIEP
ncbi:hypothetical protein IV203_012452 [Nitzschia inconspicua]|uniref:Uncharacterized protein n=1 Tax=Nitzschia inconspicua TaxID=303405 RepID=A0A9K3PJR8_9STRA|nr:hypothetical protein IV203_012452 [Nitzschia inconspicua]